MAVRRLDLGRTWADVLAMTRANGDVIVTLMGMFVALPGLVSTWILPDWPRLKQPATLQQLVDANMTYVSAHWPVMLLSAVIVAFGSLALSALLVHPGRPTVGEALRLGIAALPFYILTNILQTLVVSAGLLLLVLPGVYLLARFLCIAPVAVVEKRVNPLSIVARSFQLTRGNGLRIILMMVVIFAVAVITSTALQLVFGITGALLLPPDLARFLGILVNTLVETGIATTVTLVSASLYRQATAKEV